MEIVGTSLYFNCPNTTQVLKNGYALKLRKLKFFIRYYYYIGWHRIEKMC